MAGRGPAPKDASARRRRNADPIPNVTVAADEALRGPDLPELADGPDGPREWAAATLAWWDTWRRSAQAQTFTATDWDFLTDTALLHAAYWSGDLKQGAELRLRVAKYGATPEDRARLRLQVDTGETDDKPAAPTTQARRAASSRKDRILRAVNGEAAG